MHAEQAVHAYCDELLRQPDADATATDALAAYEHELAERHSAVGARDDALLLTLTRMMTAVSFRDRGSAADRRQAVAEAPAAYRQHGCRETAVLLAARANGTIEPADTEALQAHLDECPECRGVDAHVERAERLFIAALSEPERIVEPAPEPEPETVVTRWPPPEAEPELETVVTRWPPPEAAPETAPEPAATSWLPEAEPEPYREPEPAPGAWAPVTPLPPAPEPAPVPMPAAWTPAGQAQDDPEPEPEQMPAAWTPAPRAQPESTPIAESMVPPPNHIADYAPAPIGWPEPAQRKRWWRKD